MGFKVPYISITVITVRTLVFFRIVLFEMSCQVSNVLKVTGSRLVGTFMLDL